jgi:hypothetical protein
MGAAILRLPVGTITFRQPTSAFSYRDGEAKEMWGRHHTRRRGEGRGQGGVPHHHHTSAPPPRPRRRRRQNRPPPPPAADSALAPPRHSALLKLPPQPVHRGHRHPSKPPATSFFSGSGDQPLTLTPTRKFIARSAASVAASRGIGGFVSPMARLAFSATASRGIAGCGSTCGSAGCGSKCGTAGDSGEEGRGGGGTGMGIPEEALKHRWFLGGGGSRGEGWKDRRRKWRRC